MFSNSAIFRINVFIIVLFLFLPAIASAKTSGQKAEQGQGCRTSSLGIISDICEKGLICQIEAGALSECGSGLNELCNGVCRSITGAESKYGLGTESGFTNTSIGQTSDLKGTIAKIINIILGFLGIGAVIIILIGGFKWMTAAGNEDQIAEARKYIINGVIGLVVVFASWAIASFVIGNLSSATGSSSSSGAASMQQQGGDSGDNGDSDSGDGGDSGGGDSGGGGDEGGSDPVCDSDNLNLCTESECSGAGGNWCSEETPPCQADPCVPEGPQDTDLDGLSDWDEQNIYCSDLNNIDTDSDGHLDTEEAATDYPLGAASPGGSCEYLTDCEESAITSNDADRRSRVEYQIQVCCTRNTGQDICEGIDLLSL